jgi:sugar phosphate permease
MSLHQTGVYAGTIAGGAAAGWFAQHYGWRSPFVFFGALGIAAACLLLTTLREPERGASDAKADAPGAKARPARIGEVAREVLGNPTVDLLILAFIGANFVAVVFLAWMPSFLYQKFSMSLTMAGWSATAYFQTASVAGVFAGGILADRFSRARIAVQAFGLLLGMPFVFLTGWTRAIPTLILAMTCYGFFKGMYDANIFAGLYEVVAFDRRAVAAGLLNSLGWLGAGFAPVLIAKLSAHYGMSACLSATAGIYLVSAALLGAASMRVARGAAQAP